MMASYNKVILMGNLTDRPELRFTKAGKPFTRFGLAVNERFKGGDGEQQEKVSFFNVSSFGRQAEVLSQYLEKGSPLLVDGQLDQHRWEDPEGQKRSSVSVKLRGFQFLPRRSGAGGSRDQAA